MTDFFPGEMKFPMPNQDPECEVHHHLMGDGRCSCLPHGQVFGPPKPVNPVRCGYCLNLRVECRCAPKHAVFDHLLEILDEIPTAPVPMYSKPRDTAAIAVARGQAELLSKYGAALETYMKNNQCKRNCTCCVDLQARATLAREMSVIYFRAAELEEKP